MSKTLPKWTEDRENELSTIVGNETPVTRDTVQRASEALETTTRSIASKLRKMGFDVEKADAEYQRTFSDEEETKLRKFVEANVGKFTFVEIAEQVFGDASKARAVQGKLLSMELSSSVKKAEPKVVVKKYSEAEEATFIEMANSGAYLEDIAEKLNKPLNSVRGKALALSRSAGISIPKQKQSYAKAEAGDPIAALDNVSEMTVAQIAEAIDKTERGVKTMLTYRKLACADYDGFAKAEKNARKADKVA